MTDVDPAESKPTRLAANPPSALRRRAGTRDQWLGVDLRHLAALAAVARERSFSAAADQLGYVQSAVSQQISYLERIIGTRLVERGKGPQPISLTPAGEVLLSHVDDILSQLRAAQSEIQGLIEGQGRTLRIGVDHGLSAWFMPSLLPRFRAQFPEVSVVTRETSTDADLFRLVAEGEIDAAFADVPLEPGPFDSETLITDPFVLVVQADSPLAHAPVKLECLGALPLIGHHTSRMAPQVETSLRERGVEPEIVFRSNVTATVQALVGAGLGAAILPRLAVDEADPNTTTVPLPDLPPRSIAVFWRRERYGNEVLAGFRAAARAAAASLTAATEVY